MPLPPQHFDKLINFRDIGGLPTCDGKVMQTGLIYRSEELYGATRADLARVDSLNLGLIIDLRSPKNHKKRVAPVSARVVNVPIVEPGSYRLLPGFLFDKSGAQRFHDFCLEFYRSMALQQTARFGEAINLIAQTENLPVLIHCRAGKDRTGVLVALIQLLAGVSYDLVAEDYLRTNSLYAPRLDKIAKFMPARDRIRLMMSAHPDYLQEFHSSLLQHYGSVDEYLSRGCSVEAPTLASLKNRLLTDDTAE
jgi:protein-tyrosine phosphatase